MVVINCETTSISFDRTRRDRDGRLDDWGRNKEMREERLRLRPSRLRRLA
jgi:hypothetical protein